ncbi:MAG: type II secretion system F family protein [Thiobacillus sp.]|uniref:type II secretion system F family protein n=1 Tax=Thiobacillus sp. TaxID=924 RepID=UPI0028955E3C|nr:type II secretion system F family protein [Thiobacillus sp.]MDT3706342.1 type II secretion system F family protein [Thiobacillus sp.]
MPTFAYVALLPTGVRVREEAVADSEDALRADLAGRGLLVQSVRAGRTRIGLRAGRVSPEEFALFNQEFMALIRAGLTVPDALALAAKRPDSPALGQMLARVLHDVQNGALLSEACARHPEAFERLYVAALRTGEKTGDLFLVLGRYHDYLKHRVALRKKLTQALAYPLFLLAALGVILAVLFVFVMPRFVAMYADLGTELPLATRVLMALVERAYVVVPLVIAAVAVCVWGWRRWTSTIDGRRQVDQMKEKLPYLGELQRIVSAAQLARSLSTLLAGGTPLVDALRTAAGSLGNQVHLDRLEAATQRVVGGESLNRAVRATRLLPETAARMVEVGEASGSLDTMLAEVAQFYEDILDARLARSMALIEPLLMLLMGLIIGGIIIVMYLPIFRMAEVIK